MRKSNHQKSDSRLARVLGVFSIKRRAPKPQPSAATRPEWSRTFWGQKFVRSVSLVVALFCSASIVLADVKITTKSMAGGQSLTSTTYIKGSRQRTEGMGYTSIYQCDLKRSIQINDKTKTYFITPLAGANAAAGARVNGTGTAAGTKARRGGVVTYTTTATDTGERKQIMGLTARRVKTRTVISASEGACNPMNMEMETDGWYVDLPGGLSCATDGSNTPLFPVDQSDCVDEVRFKTEGTAKLGYPVETTTRMKFNTGGEVEPIAAPTSSSTQEVVDISTATLDAALFDIPAGYREVKTMQELGSPY